MLTSGVEAPTRPADIRSAVDGLLAQPVPSLCQGDTPARWSLLYRWARTGSPAAARLAEAHVDAESILADSDLAPFHERTLYGVWASEGPAADVRYDPRTGTISGAKPFCSGLGIVDRALVTAGSPDGAVLCDVAAPGGCGWSPDDWQTPALAGTRTGAVSFDRQPVHAVIGEPGDYSTRPRFWHHAIGPAACWAGIAAGLADHARSFTRSGDDLDEAAFGDLQAQRYNMETLLAAAGRASDDEPEDGCGARVRALATRHLIERSASHIADRFSRAYGPRPFVGDHRLAARHADLHLYLRQHHDERSLAELGRRS